MRVLKPRGSLIVTGWGRKGAPGGDIGLHQQHIYLAAPGRLKCETHNAPMARSQIAYSITEALRSRLVESS
jgi:hypothetical protein